MKEISLNILDIATNSVRADATQVDVTVEYATIANTLTVIIADNGKGMTEEFLKSVTDPFTTTRTTRRVGLGIPLFRQSVTLTGGTFDITSRVGVGTKTSATYVLDSIDRMPMGDLASTMTTLVGLKDSIRYKLVYRVDGREFVFDTDEVKDILGEVSISAPEVTAFLTEYISSGIKNINGGSEVI